MSSLYHGYKLYMSSDTYHLEPRGPGSDGASSLKIDRKQNDLSLTTSTVGRGEKTMDVQAVLGIISLHTSDFLIVVSSSKKVSSVLKADVFMATDFRVLPLDSETNKSVMRHPIEKTLLDLLKMHLFSAPFYFSYEYDLTSSMQRQAKLAAAAGGAETPVWQRADDRFFWNRHLQSRLIDLTQSGKVDLSRFIQPFLFGFLQIKSATVDGRDFVFGLISRRSRFRTGTRYFSRGIDKDGHVSNYNETEQFLLLDPTSAGKTQGTQRFSYVQVRGSVPVYWAEVNNLRYKPDLLIMEKEETVRSDLSSFGGMLLTSSLCVITQLEAARKHFDEQVSIYGDIYLANLVNQKGYELPVKEAYERLVAKLDNPKVHYTYYDFHHECKGMKFERVFGLVESMKAQGLESDE